MAKSRTIARPKRYYKSKSTTVAIPSSFNYKNIYFIPGMLTIVGTLLTGILFYNSSNKTSINNSLPHTNEPAIPNSAIITKALIHTYRGNFESLKDILTKNKKAKTIIDNYSRTHPFDTFIHRALQGRHDSWRFQSTSVIGQHEDIISYLITDVHVNVNYGCPLYYAAHYRNLLVLPILLNTMSIEDSLKCITQLDSSGETVLHAIVKSKASGFAQFYSKLISTNGTMHKPADNVMKILGLSGKVPVLPGGELSLSSLNSVISHKDLDLLVDHFHSHLDLSNLTDIHGNTILHVASYAGRNSAVKFLLDKGVPVNKRNNMELLPIDLAIKAGHDSIVDMLSNVNGLQYKNRDPVCTTLSSNCEVYSKNKLNLLSWYRYQSFSGWTSFDYDISDLVCSHMMTVQASNINSEQFLMTVEKHHVPIVLQDVANDWPALQHWTKEQLIQRYGSLKIKVSRMPYEDLYSQRTKTIPMALSDYVDSFVNTTDTPLYLFDGQIFEKQATLINDIIIPSFLTNRSIYLKQFILGPKNSGSPPHFHGKALNVLIYGLKMWYFWQPSKAYFSFQHISQLTNKMSQLENTCMQYLQFPGESIYIPENWGHAVINIEDSVGVAFEYR